jgi:formylmethanofuran dehydrogenase subunit B
MPTVVRVQPNSCGLPCVPTTLETLDDGSTRVTGGCPACREEAAAFRDAGLPSPREAGGDALSEKIGAAAAILLESRAPFIYGLGRSATVVARRAAALAAILGGAVDIEGADIAGADLLALQSFGLPGATFGEIRNRADLLLLWRCDPRATHTRLFERPSRTPCARMETRVVVIVPAGTAAPPAGAGDDLAAGGAAHRATDLVLPARAGRDLEIALSLRALVNDIPPAGESIGGVPLAVLREAAERLRRARYAAILWDPAATAGAGGDAVASSLALLARDLNRHTRCVARPLGAGGNVAAAMAALAAACGYPRAVSFASGTPRYGPGEHDAARMIGDGRADVLVLVGARLQGDRPKGDRRARRERGRTRVVAIGPRLPRGFDEADVFIRTAVPGISAPGSAGRADGLHVALPAALPPAGPAEETVLEMITRQVQALRRSSHAQDPGRPAR